MQDVNKCVFHSSSHGYFRTISFPEPTCLLVSSKTLTKGRVGSWNEIELCTCSLGFVSIVTVSDMFGLIFEREIKKSSVTNFVINKFGEKFISVKYLNSK